MLSKKSRDKKAAAKAKKEKAEKKEPTPEEIKEMFLTGSTPICHWGTIGCKGWAAPRSRDPFCGCTWGSDL